MGRGRRAGPDLVALLLLLAAGLALAAPRYRYGLGLGDEGALAYGALRALQGELPSRDFVSLQPPLSYYSGALVYALFGASVHALRALGVVLYLASALLVYALARRLADPPLAAAAGAGALALGLPQFRFVPGAVWLGIPAVLAGAWLFARALETGRRRDALLAGLANGLAGLARQDQAVYLALAVLGGVLLASRAQRPPRPAMPLLGAWAGGVAALALPALLLALASGALPELFRQLVLFPLTTYPETSSLPMPALRAAASAAENAIAALFYAPPVLLVGVLARLGPALVRRRLSPEDTRLAFVALLGLLFYAQVLTRSDLLHLLITLPPVFALAAGALARGRDVLERRLPAALGGGGVGARRRRAATGALLLAVALLGAVLLAAAAPRLFPERDPSARPLRLERAGVRLPPERARLLEELVASIRRHAPPGRPVLCLPYHPMLYFLAERENPTRWNHLWPGDLTEAELRSLLRRARAARPAVVVLVEGRRLRRWMPAVVAWVERDYRRLERRGAVALYVRRDAGR